MLDNVIDQLVNDFDEVHFFDIPSREYAKKKAAAFSKNVAGPESPPLVSVGNDLPETIEIWAKVCCKLVSVSLFRDIFKDNLERYQNQFKDMVGQMFLFETR